MILFFDTETTGIRKGGFVPRVVQIGALLTDDQGKTMGELNVLLQPEGFDHVPQVAQDVHGFSYALLQAYGINRHVGLDAFFQLVDRAETIVAHNIEYDLDLLSIELDYERDNGSNQYVPEAWSDVLKSKQQFCTMQNSRDTLMMPLSDAQARFFRDTGNDQKFKNPRLIEAYQHFFHKDFEGAHDAMADVRACRDVYFELHKLKSVA